MSNPAFDLDGIKRDHPVSSIARNYTTLAKNGDEFTGLCPFHKEKTPSFHCVDKKGFAHCFGCGWHGDVIALLRDMHHVSFEQACEILQGERQAPVAMHPVAEHRDAPSLYATLRPAPIEAWPEPGQPLRCWNPKRGRWSTFEPSMIFPYRDAAGVALGLVARIDLGEGRKMTPTVRRAAMPGDAIAWVLWPFERPRPLYGADILAARPADPVLWVEGEKAADAARRLLPAYAVIAAPGGGKALAHVDWSALAGRDVTIWGDADGEGEVAMFDAAALIDTAGAAAIHLVPWDRARDKGWDCADAEAEGMGGDAVLAWLVARRSQWTSQSRAPEPPLQPDAPYLPGAPSPETSNDDAPFQVLGYDQGVFYYLPHGGQQIIALAAQAHTKANLLLLAPPHYWEANFPARQGFDALDAENALLRRAETVGIFDPDRVRGRGAWIDAGKPTVHYGHRVRCDDKSYLPHAMPSPFIYQRGKPLPLTEAAPLTNQQAHELVEVCERFCFTSLLSASLLAGWIVTAPVCGALKHRPHIWITGPAHSGKTTIEEGVVMPMLDGILIKRDGTTTEAHLRQKLGHDALPMLIEEAESESKAAAEKIKAVLSLARIASGGGVIGKGGANGVAVDYTVRTQFCFVSINTSVTEYADETRISRLATKVYRGPDLEAYLTTLNRAIATTITPEFAAGMFARTVANLPTLIANAQMFRKVAIAALRNARAADQIGTLAAGAYLCHSTGRIDELDALGWIGKWTEQWSEYTAIESANDETKLLSAIATTRRRLPVTRGMLGSNIGSAEFTIGELLLMVNQAQSHHDITRDDVARELGRTGLRVLDETHFAIANRSPELARILAGTPWAADWKRGLRSLPGAKPYPEAIRFSPGLRERATLLPLALLEN